MNLRKLEVFIRAVDLSSLSKAAEELGYTQSGISHMIKGLEEEVGFPLLTRSSAGIQPNQEGRMLLPVIRELLARQETLNQSIDAIKGLETGQITIGSFSSVAIHWLPGILQSFGMLHPNIRIHIIEGGVDVMERMLLEARIDLCFFARGDRRGFDWLPLREDPLLCLMPKDHPLANAPHFPVEAFQDDWFIAPSRGFDYDVHRVLDRLPEKPKVKFSSQSDHIIISMVASGLGLSILPKLILTGFESKVACAPLHPAFTRELGIGIPSLQLTSPAARSFLSFAQSYISKIKI